ncbi:MAG: HEAT repeat domain-containing protein [Ignavibacteriae bacterium]|nr:HEAT repeat domain-containing protein [Ignavibacteriota bacterium]
MMMFHRHYRELLPLRAAGRLSAGDAAKLDRHLGSCAQCRKELDEIRHLQAIMAAVADDRSADPALAATRTHAANAFRDGGYAHGRRTRDRFPRTGLVPSGVAYAGIGLALLVTGFFGGKLAGQRMNAADQLAAGDPEIRVIQVVAPSQDGDSVMITYEQVRTVRLHGALDDPQISHVLARALISGENAGVRLRALEAVAATDQPSPQREIRAALMLALTSDPNVGVRRQALDALRRMPQDTGVRDVLLQVLLHDNNPGLRIAAINALDSLQTNVALTDETTRSSLRKLVAGEDNMYVQVKARSLLEGRIQ